MPSQAEEIRIADLEPVSFYEGREHDKSFIQGEALQKRAQELGALHTRADAEKILARQEEIPIAWQGGMFLFPHGEPRFPRKRETLSFLHYSPSESRWILGEDGLTTFCVRWTSRIFCLRLKKA